MGTGKSTAGRKVAEKLRFSFIDSDHAIEKKYKKSIPKIFEEQGEEAFRQMEKEFVQNGHPESGCVIACGGGLVCQPGMMDSIKEKGFVVSLWASIDGIVERTSQNQNRPLLNVESPEDRIQKLMQDRAPIYNQAHASLTTEYRSVNDVVQNIVRVYREFERHLLEKNDS